MGKHKSKHQPDQGPKVAIQATHAAGLTS